MKDFFIGLVLGLILGIICTVIIQHNTDCRAKGGLSVNGVCIKVERLQ